VREGETGGCVIAQLDLLGEWGRSDGRGLRAQLFSRALSGLNQLRDDEITPFFELEDALSCALQ